KAGAQLGNRDRVADDGHVARHGHPLERNPATERPWAKAYGPGRNRDPHALGHAQQQHRHHAMYRGADVLFERTLPERQERLVHHQLDPVATTPAPAYPTAEGDVQRPPTERMRYPLDEQAPWPWTTVQFGVQPS